MRVSENEQKHWDNIAKQFPYNYKGSDLVIALVAGFIMGLWLGFIGSFALY